MRIIYEKFLKLEKNVWNVWKLPGISVSVHILELLESFQNFMKISLGGPRISEKFLEGQGMFQRILKVSWDILGFFQ